MKVLVVDDSRSLTNLVKRIVETMGHQAVVAEDGLHGLELLKQGGFDCVLLDWNLPGMNGLEVLAAIRQDHPSHLPVLMLTAEDKEEQVNSALEKGASGYIVKPFDPEMLRARLKLVASSR